jgi:hypothetical protein
VTVKGARTTYKLEAERGARGQITVATAKVPRMTYNLGVEREGKRSDHSCNCKGTKNDIQPGGGEGRQEVRS